MAAGALSVVTATTQRVATLELLQDLVQRREETAIIEHYEPELDAVFKLRAINGAQLDKVLALANGNDAKYRQLLVNEASVEPKIDSKAWGLIQRLSPRVRGRLITAIWEISGLNDSAIEQAKNTYGETEDES